MTLSEQNFDPAQGGAGEFQTTHWSAVTRAGNQRSPGSAAALEALCRAYWYPLYVFVRRQGHPPIEAQDLIQDFFAHLLEEGVVGSARPERGRFRTFLLASLKNHLIQKWRRDQRVKRGGGIDLLSLEEAAAEALYQREPADPLTPELVYERRWAATLLENVLARLRGECDGPERARRFEVLKVFLLEAKGTLSFGEAATQLGLNEDATRAVVQRLRARYRELVHEEISHTVERPADVADEIRHLVAVLGG